MHSKPHVHFQLSTFDSTTNTLLLYNPMEKSITLFDLELELQKVKRKVKLLDIPKPQKIQKASSGKLHHKTSLVLSSGRKKLSLLANTEEKEEIGSGSGERNPSDSSGKKRDSMVHKTLQGYLRHNLREPRKETLNEFLNFLFSPAFREKLLKGPNPHCFSEGRLIDGEVHEERVTFNICSYVKGRQLVYFVGTDLGNVFMFPLLFNANWNYYPYFVFRDQVNSPVQHLYIQKNCLFIEQNEGRVLTLELQFEGEGEEARVFFGKSPPGKDLETEWSPGVQEVNVNKWVRSEVYLDSPIREFLKMKTLKIEGELSEKENNFSCFKANIDPVALLLENNNVAVYSIQRHHIELELKGNRSPVLALYLHPYLDEILTFNAKGFFYVYNLPSGMLDRVIPIENYAHLFNFSMFTAEAYMRYNVHSLRKFLEIEEFQTSKQHFLVDYSLRFENYLLNYSAGKELFAGKKPEGSAIMKQVNSSHILANAIEMTGSEGVNPNVGSPVSNLNTRQASSNEAYESEAASNYERRKAESLGMLVYERNGDYLQSLKKPERENAMEIKGLLDGRKAMVRSHNKDQGVSILAFDPHQKTGNKPKNDLGYILFFDAKLNVRNLKTLNENEGRFPGQPSYFSYVSLLFPWGIDKEHDAKMLPKVFNRLPVFQLLHGIQGSGEAFTFLTTNKEKWAVSDYLSTMHALSLLYFITSFDEKELKICTNYFLKIIEAFSRRKRMHEKTNPCVNLPLVCKYFLDTDGDLMTAAYNLLISSMKNKDVDFTFVLDNPLGLYRLTSNEKIKPEGFSYSLVIWGLMIGYTSVFYEKSKASAEDCIKDIVLLTE